MGVSTLEDPNLQNAAALAEMKMPEPQHPLHVLNDTYPDSMYNWVEVTEPFMTAVQDLSLGELLHDETFGLFEAMSAIEMMDPKMDAGMICNRQNARPFTFQTAVKAQHLKLKDISLSEQIGVIDATLAALVTWLEGHALAQTVFTNLYLHQPYDITHPLMRAFSIVVLKLVDIIKEIVSRGNVFEEEDFLPTSYCFKLAPEVSELRAGGMLREIEDELHKTIRNLKPKQGETQTKQELEERESTMALFSRIRFLRSFYMALLSAFKNDCAESNRHLNLAKEHVVKVKETVHLGSEPKDSKENMMGFDRLANQRLLPPTFPRYTEIQSRPESIEYLQKLLDRIISALNITKINSFQAALDFCEEFSAQRPCVLARSVAQAMYLPLQSMATNTNLSVSGSASKPFFGNPAAAPSSLSMGHSSFQELLRESCKQFIAPPALMFIKNQPFNGKLVKDCLDAFFNQCCRPLGMLVQIFGHNKARQRDKMAALLEEFSNFQEEADKLDTMLNAVSSQSPDGRPHMLFFSTWLLYHVLTVMVNYILSGFDLELYSYHEYPYLFWYLYELLYPWLTTCLHRADAYLLEYEQLLESQKTTSRHNKKKTKSVNKKQKPARPYVRKIAQFQGSATMCAGFFKLLVALKSEKKIVVPSANYDNECIRYEHRFQPFAHLLTPPLMPFGQYYEIYEITVQNTSQDLLLAAARDFQRARQIFDSLLPPPQQQQQDCSEGSVLELRQLINVNKNNFVASSILAKDLSRKIDFEFSAHSTFPSVRFV